MAQTCVLQLVCDLRCSTSQRRARATSRFTRAFAVLRNGRLPPVRDEAAARSEDLPSTAYCLPATAKTLGYSLRGAWISPVSGSLDAETPSVVGGRVRRNFAAHSRTDSAMRTFSGHVSAARPFCHAAWRSSSLRVSVIQEPRLEPRPRIGQSVPGGQPRYLLAAHAARFQQRQNPGKVFGSART